MLEDEWFKILNPYVSDTSDAGGVDMQAIWI